MKIIRLRKKVIFLSSLLIITSFLVCRACFAEDIVLSEGQTIYVPVYSHIYVMKGHSFELAISLSIRNTDPDESVTIQSVRYYDSDGQLIRNYVESPMQLKPMASTHFFVSESDKSGGFGASFIVKWNSRSKVNEPIVEGVMAGTKSGQGISFISRGKPIQEKSRK
ncbi:MAG TPA: DUF3124 domain-containing protein [Desulfomonilaceae bacterium]|nr:DUF3124 domain-containing protein [Desulfomonilaceae bacterium]